MSRPTAKDLLTKAVNLELELMDSDDDQVITIDYRSRTKKPGQEPIERVFGELTVQMGQRKRKVDWEDEPESKRTALSFATPRSSCGVSAEAGIGGVEADRLPSNGKSNNKDAISQTNYLPTPESIIPTKLSLSNPDPIFQYIANATPADIDRLQKLLAARTMQFISAAESPSKNLAPEQGDIGTKENPVTFDSNGKVSISCIKGGERIPQISSLTIFGLR